MPPTKLKPFSLDDLRRMAEDAESGSLPATTKDIQRMLLTACSFAVGLHRIAYSTTEEGYRMEMHLNDARAIANEYLSGRSIGCL